MSNYEVDLFRNQVTAGLERVGDATEGSLAVQKRVAALQAASLDASSAQLDEMRGMRSELQGLGGLLSQQNALAAETTEEVRQLQTELKAGFDTVSGDLQDIRDALKHGFERASAQLAEILKATRESESTRLFNELKSTAFEWAVDRNSRRALTCGVKALSLRDARFGDVLPDHLRFDPELNILVAELLFTKVEPSETIEARSPWEYARNAYEFGKRDGTPPPARQAAATAAHHLAVEARMRGEFAEGAILDRESYRLETIDRVRSLAQAYAALVLTEPPEQIGKAVAVASVVYPRFLPIYLMQPALLLDVTKADRVIEVAKSYVVRAFEAAGDALSAQTSEWRELCRSTEQPPHELLEETHQGAPATMIELVASTRARFRKVLSNASQIFGWTSSRCKTVGDIAVESMATLTQDASTVDQETNKALHRKVSLRNGVLSGAVLLTGTGCAAPLAWFVLLFITAGSSCATRSAGSVSQVLPFVMAAAALWATARIVVSVAARRDISRRVARQGEIQNARTEIETLYQRVISGLYEYQRRAAPQSYLSAWIGPTSQPLHNADERACDVENLVALGGSYEPSLAAWLAPAQREFVELSRTPLRATSELSSLLASRPAIKALP